MNVQKRSVTTGVRAGGGLVTLSLSGVKGQSGAIHWGWKWCVSALETPCAACTPLATVHGTSHARGPALSPFLSAGQVRALITQEVMTMQTCLGEALLLPRGQAR